MSDDKPKFELIKGVQDTPKKDYYLRYTVYRQIFICRAVPRPNFYTNRECWWKYIMSTHATM